jgi:hypothetical protein
MNSVFYGMLFVRRQPFERKAIEIIANTAVYRVVRRMKERRMTWLQFLYSQRL